MNPNSIIDFSRFNRQTILLVEDDEDDVLLMQTAFREADVPNPLRVVGDGEQAIAYLQGEGSYGDRRQYPLPVVILLDLNMPKKSGLEVLEWLRKQPGLRRTTVHILTASSRSVDVTRAFDLGANAYLVKPSKLQALFEMVRTWHRLAQFEIFPALRS
jgi:CheY-like chemotaxis protein